MQLQYPSCRAAIARARAVVLSLLVFVPMTGVQNRLEAQATVPVAPDHAEKMKQGTELFKSRVRNILSERCLKCHGGEKVQGELDLSSRESLLASGFVDLKATESSSLVASIEHTSEPHMPKDAPKLSDSDIKTLRSWLSLGAPYDAPLHGSQDQPKAAAVTDEDRNFWSFRPLTVPRAPNDPSGWSRNEIDRFVADQLRRHELAPNLDTDQRRLARRAYFDLIGLPPTEADLTAFLNDKSDDAYERLIERLLDMPQYGERWARHWMDIARFAESHGYEQDYDRPFAYHYRDFLIRALNADLPYDQFVQWQVAGDELEPNNPLAVTATGFLGSGAFPTQLTEVEFESARYDELDDMGATLGTAVLGLSVGCARCHAHKFDPIPASDYYRFIANFAKTIRSEIDLDLEPEENNRRREAHSQEVALLKKRLSEYEADRLDSDAKQWLKAADLEQIKSGPWNVLKGLVLKPQNGSRYESQPDGSWLAVGQAPAKEVLKITASGPIQSVQALRLEALADPSLPQRGPGRAGNGNFALGDVKLQTVDRAGQGVRDVKLRAARATHQQNADSLSVAASIDGDRISGWAVDMGGIGKDQAAVFELETPLNVAEGELLLVELVFEHPNAAHAIGRFRLSVSSDSQAAATVGGSGVEPNVVAALKALKAEWKRDSADYSTARTYLASQLKEYSELKGKLQQLESAGPALKISKVQVTGDGLPHMKHHADDRGYPHFYPEVFVLARGDAAQKRGVARPGYLQVLTRGETASDAQYSAKPSEAEQTQHPRASLARWLTDVDHGAGALAARVMVNRVWQHHFGRGIVATPSDFGKQGDAPTHPELLEWLANDLVSHGWKLKRLHKLIMLSSTYRQSSAFDEAKAVKDRENQFLWRFQPRRVEAEAIRDSWLAVSGELNPTMYGPGTLDESMKRRSVYFFIKRSQLIPMMMLFDWPEHLVGIGNRPVTTVAPQALAMMNNAQCRRWSEALAKRVMEEPVSETKSESSKVIGQALSVDDQQRDRLVGRLYMRALGRMPRSEEISLAREFLKTQQTKHQDAGAPNGGTDGARMAAFADLCQAVLSMNEMIYVD